MRIIGVDHTGAEPVLVIRLRRSRGTLVHGPSAGRGGRGSRLAARPGQQTTREEEATHAHKHGGRFGDGAPPQALTRVNPSAYWLGGPRPRRSHPLPGTAAGGPRWGGSSPWA